MGNRLWSAVKGLVGLDDASGSAPEPEAPNAPAGVLAEVDWEPPAEPQPGQPRLQWRLSRPIPELATTPTRGSWDREATLRDVIRCPGCGVDGRMTWAEDAVTCGACDTRYHRHPNGVVDLISSEQAAAAQIFEAETVSRHTYDVAARALIEKVRARGGTVLDCGAGAHIDAWDNVIRIEIKPYDFTDLLAVNQALPFRDDAFDVVFTLNVLEHVNDPWGCAREIMRVVKPGGIVYAVVPFLQPVHGYPEHYFNMTTSGLRRLFEADGAVEMQFIPAAGQPIFTLDWFLRSYMAGLDPETAAKFGDLTVREIVEAGAIGQLDLDYVRGLGAEARAELASTTGAFIRKPEAAG